MTRKEELLASYDAALNREWESIQSAIKNLTEEEASYQHPAFSNEPQVAGQPLAGSVRWYLCHLANCYRLYVEIVKMRPIQPAEQPPIYYNTVSEAITMLQQDRDKLRAIVADLEEEQLDDHLYYGGIVADLVRGSVRHDAWHSGQIALVRRLYKMREM